MNRLILTLAAAVLLASPAAAKSKTPKPPKASTKAEKVSLSARRDFIRLHPCPSNGKTSGSCPGYKVVYVVPLAKGGVSAPSNMEWRAVSHGKVL